MPRQRLPKKRSADWVMLANAAQDALKDLRHACDLLAVQYRQIQGWNQEYANSVGVIGNANLKLTRDYIVSAGLTLKTAVKGVQATRGDANSSQHENRVFPGILPVDREAGKRR
jgi:hypothetical protein